MSIIDESIFSAWSSTPWLQQTMVSGGGAASPQEYSSGRGGNGGTPPMQVFTFNNPLDPESDTPRCNAAFALSDTHSRAAFARQLERELAIVVEQRQALRDQNVRLAVERDEWREKAEAYRLAAARRDEEMNHQAERAARWRQCAESLANHVRTEFDDETAELNRFFALRESEQKVQL